MSDPFEILKSADRRVEPDPEFRVRLMGELDRSFDSNGRTTVADPVLLDPLLETVLQSGPSPERWPARYRTLLVVAAAAVAAVAAIVVVRERDASVPPLNDQPSASTAVSTTTAPRRPLADWQIASAAILSREEVGDGFLLDAANPIPWSVEDQPAADDPACGPYLDTVFASDRRPATTRVMAFGKPGSAFQENVVVFPTEQAAVAMMDAVAEPAFEACLAAVAAASYEADVNGIADVIQQPADPRPLTQVGDQMVVLALSGSFVLDGTSYPDEGLFPFVRVGRAVVFMNPSSAKTLYGSPGYPDAQLEIALAAVVEHLRDAQ